MQKWLTVVALSLGLLLTSVPKSVAYNIIAGRRTLVVAPTLDLTKAELDSVSTACRVWNTAVGRPVLIFAKSDSPDVWVTPVYAYDDDNTIAETCFGYKPLLVSIVEHQTWDELMTTKTLIHEFGHVLGLNHSKDKASVMYPYINDCGFYPDAKDIAEVRARWAL